MIKVLLVDDSNDKIAKVIMAIREFSENIFVEVVVDFISAQNQLISSNYDLLILDMNLPIRQGEEPNIDVGKNLLNEINRKKGINSPKYIVSLTQYPDLCNEISDIWPTIKYIPENDDWKISIVGLIKHIIKCGNILANEIQIKPTIFFEGKTDEKMFLEALLQFRPDLVNLITLKSEKQVGGASWVARQIIVWSHSLSLDSEGHYIKAIGLLDGDKAGKDANEEINRVVKTDSAQGKTFKTIKLTQAYAKHLISIKQKGLNIPICLEEMFPLNNWEHANTQNWLELRSKPEHFLTDPQDWDKFNVPLKDHLSNLELSDGDRLYLNCVKEENKIEFSKYISKLGDQEKKLALQCFEKLIDDISSYFFKTEKVKETQE